MKNFILGMMCCLLLFSLVACKNSSSPSAPTQAVLTNPVEHIRSDLLPENTELDRAVADAVTVTVTEQTPDSVTVVVNAPNVTENMLQWLDTADLDALTDEAMQQQLINALSGQTQAQAFQLQVENCEFVYSFEFRDASTCGFGQLYTDLYLRILEQLEEAES